MFSLDIETIPNLNLISLLPEPEPSANIKDPEKIAADIAKKKQAAVDKMALSPLTGRICSYAMYFDCLPPQWDVINEISDAEEINLINKILCNFVLTNTTYPTICTWNGHKFDIPFIAKRSMILNIDLPTGFPGFRYFMKKYSITPHIDLFQELCNWGTEYISLNTASKMILGESKIDLDYTKFIELIESGKREEIGLYNLKDAELTYKLWVKMEKYIF